MSTTRTDRWEREAAFFDEKARAERAAGLTIHAETVERYRNARRARFYAEYRFVGSPSLAGKRVLDIGCGDGRETVLLALLGANVTGIDISPEAIEVAKERAAVNGVPDRCEFACQPLESADFGDQRFDIIWCDAFLHHVIPDMEPILLRMREWLTPGGEVVITEPVSLSAGFRRARLALLPPPDATPDERPLEPAELAIMQRAFPQHRARYFNFLTRVARFVLPGGNFERSPQWRQWIYEAAAFGDQVIFALGGRALASQIIFHGRRPASA